MKARIEYMSTPNGKCGLDVSPEEKENEFAEQPATTCHREEPNQGRGKKMNRWTKRDEMEGFPCGSAVNAGDTIRTLIWEDATEQLSP